MKTKYLFIAGIFFSILLSTLVMTEIFSASEGVVTIVNNSMENISGVTLEICKQKFSLNDLKPGSRSQKMHFKITRDSSYKIHVTFTSGASLSKENIGYVTHGFDENDTLTIKNEDISLERVSSISH